MGNNYFMLTILGMGMLLGALFVNNALHAEGTAKQPDKQYPPALDFTMKTIDGEEVHLGEAYENKVILIVNVASKCGYTVQYADLQKLYEKHEKDGLVILGFPCNQFRNQEPGTNKQIAEFCRETYGVAFPMFEKIDVNGEKQAPLYRFLTNKKTNPKAPDNEKIDWNFEKFLIGRDGRVLAHYRSKVKPTDEEFVKAVQQALAQQPAKKSP